MIESKLDVTCDVPSRQTYSMNHAKDDAVAMKSKSKYPPAEPGALNCEPLKAA
jgi:hypothetical protein